MTGRLRRRAGSGVMRLAGYCPRGVALSVEYLGGRIAGMIEPDMRQVDRLPVSRFRRAVDVGANRGWFAHALLQRFEHVTAFEANPALASRLRRIAPRRLDVRGVALSDRHGHATLKIPVRDGRPLPGWAGFDPDPAAGADHFEEHLIECRRLDEEVHGPVDLIKIDVEGHELQVLQGGDGLIRRERPVLLVEIRPDNEAPVLALLDALGYEEQVWGTPERPCNNRLFIPKAA